MISEACFPQSVSRGMLIAYAVFWRSGHFGDDKTPTRESEMWGTKACIPASGGAPSRPSTLRCPFRTGLPSPSRR